MSEVYIGVTRDDGGVVHIAFQTEFRNGSGLIRRQPTDGNIEFELRRWDRAWQRAGEPRMTGWRMLTQDEHEQFNTDRIYRNALEDVGGKIQHNMPKARELHRAHVRHLAGDRLMLLDRDWVNASAAGDTVLADGVEQRRRALRDLAADPRIEAATSVQELKQIVPGDG